MSGGGPSSIKRSSACAARVPVLSRRYEDRVGANFDFGVYGLVLQSGAFFCAKKRLTFYIFFVFIYNICEKIEKRCRFFARVMV